MASLTSDERELIERDREEHPDCFYPSSISSSCKSVNGDYKCEILRKIFRQCPNEPRRLISERKDVTHEDGEADSSVRFYDSEAGSPEREIGDFFQSFDPFRQSGNDHQGHMDPFELFREEMMRPLEKFLSGDTFSGLIEDFFNGASKDDDSPFPSRSRPEVPPHYYYLPKEGRRNRNEASDSDARKETRDHAGMYDGPAVDI